MSLTDETKHKVVFYLGYPGTVLIETATNYNSIIVDRLNNLNSYIEDQVDVTITKLEVARAALEGSPTSFKLKQVGEIHFNTEGGLSLAKSEYRRLMKELASLLDIPSQIGCGVNFGVCVA